MFRFRHISLMTILLAIELTDELVSGFFSVGLPLVRSSLGFSYAQIGLLFTTAGIAALIIEPVANILSDQGDIRRWLIGSIGVLTIALLVAGIVRSFPLLAMSFIVIYPAIGIVLGLAQTALVTRSDQEDVAMARWTMWGSIGDFISPFLVSLLVTLSLGWRGLSWTGAAIWGVLLVFVIRMPFPPRSHPEQGDETERTLWQDIRKSLSNRRLLRWVVVLIAADMMDEIFLTFATLYLHDVRQASPVVISIIFGLATLIDIGSLFVLERVATIRSNRLLLLWLALATCGGFVFFLAPVPLWLTAIGILLIAGSTASWYPIAQAEAYSIMRGREGLMRAVLAIGEPVQIFLPLVLGVIATRYGLSLSMLVLGMAPVLVITLAPRRS